MQLSATYIGHKFRCFDVRFCHPTKDESLILTASEDGTAKLWNMRNRKCLFTFKHNKDCEVLRAAFLSTTGAEIVTCGADGKCIVWELVSTPGVNQTRKYRPVCVLDHGDAQIYVCEAMPFSPPSVSVPDQSPINANTNVNANGNRQLSPSLLTAADDKLFIWDLSNAASPMPRVWSFASIINGGLGPLNAAEVEAEAQRVDERGSASAAGSGVGSQVLAAQEFQAQEKGKDVEMGDGEGGEGEGDEATSFGGPRNTEHLAFIFDAKPCPSSPHKVAVALSDGTVRIVNTRPRLQRTSAATGTGTATTTTTSGTATATTITTTAPNARVDTISAMNVGGLLQELRILSQQVKRGSYGHAQDRKEEAITSTSTAASDESTAAVVPVAPHATGIAWGSDGTYLLVSLGDGSILLMDSDSNAHANDAHKKFMARAIFQGHKSCCFGVVCLPLQEGGKGKRGESEQLQSQSLPPDVSSSEVGAGGKRSSPLTLSSSSISTCTSTVTSIKQQRCLSWSSDGSLCEWDLSPDVAGVIRQPLRRLVIDKYPIYACALSVNNFAKVTSTEEEKEFVEGSKEASFIVCAGGSGGGGGFMGVPVHMVQLS